MTPPSRSVTVTRIGARPLFYAGQGNLDRLLAALRPFGICSQTWSPPPRADKRREQLVRVTNCLLRPLVTPRLPDVFLTDDTGFASVPLIRVLRHRPVIYVLYDDYLCLPRYRPLDSLQRPLRAPVEWNRFVNYQVASVLIVGSAETYRTASALRGSSSRVVYVPVSVDCARFDPARVDSSWLRRRLNLPDRTLVVGFAGRIEGTGIYFAGRPLIGAAAWLAKLFSPEELRFVIVGYGSKRPDFQGLVAAMGLSTYFTFTPYLNDEDYANVLAGFDVAVNTLDDYYASYTRSETKMKEYLAAGKAIVATGIGESVVDLDFGQAGVLCEPDNNDLGEQVLRFLGDADLRRAMGHRARARALAVYDTAVLAPRLYEAVMLAVGR